MKKRSISFLLTFVLCTAAFSGCGTSSDSNSSATGKNNSVSNKEGQNSVTYWIDPGQSNSANTTTFDDIPAWQEIQKNTGIDVIWEHPASGQATEQFNLIVASNELPDIMYYSWGAAYPGGPDAAINDGKIIALNDYLEQYAPNFTAYLEAHPDIAKEITTDSGNIYCFPAVYTNTTETSDVWQSAIDREPFYESFIGLIIRKDWLDELNLEIPVTLDDWYTVLKAFKEEKGVKYPLSYVNLYANMAQSLASAFDITLPVTDDGGTSAFGIREDGSIQYGPAEEGYRDYLQFMNKLYEEGLLDPDFMVQDRTTLQSKILNEEVGAWIGMVPTELGSLKTQILEENPDSSFYPVGVANPVQTEGQQLYYFQASYPYRNAGAAVTTSCKNIEAAVRLLDYCWSAEGEQLLNWGIEGESYNMTDGWPELTDKIINNDQGLSPAQAHSHYRQLNGPFPMDNWQRLVAKKDYKLESDMIDENIACLNLWAQNGIQPAGLPATTMLTDESSEYASKYNEVNTYAEEMFSKFIMGQESLDNFDSYLKTLDQLGLPRVLELQSAALDRYNKRAAS